MKIEEEEKVRDLRTSRASDSKRENFVKEETSERLGKGEILNIEIRGNLYILEREFNTCSNN